MSTIELQIDNDYNNFFAIPVRQFWKVLVLGVVLGALLAVSFPLISYITCNYFSSVCQMNPIVVTRISLIVLAIISLITMIGFGVQRSIVVALAYLAVMWVFHLSYEAGLGWRILVYAFMSATVLSLFHWLSGLRSWLLSLILTVVTAAAIVFVLINF